MASLLSQSPVRGEFLNSIYSKPSVEDVEVARKMKEILQNYFNSTRYLNCRIENWKQIRVNRQPFDKITWTKSISYIRSFTNEKVKFYRRGKTKEMRRFCKKIYWKNNKNCTTFKGSKRKKSRHTKNAKKATWKRNIYDCNNTALIKWQKSSLGNLAKR